MRFDAVKLQQYLKQGSRYSATSHIRIKQNAAPFRLRAQMLLYLLGGLFLLGILLGTITAVRASEETNQLLKAVLGGFLEERQQQTFWSIVISSFSSAAVLLLILFFCGFCSISQIIILVIPIFKGLGYGFSLAAFYQQNGIKGFFFALIVLLPGIFLQTVLLLLACKTAFLLSVRLLRGALAPPEQSEGNRLRRYCVKYSTYTVVCIVISMVDAAFFQLISAFFPLW